MTLDLRKKYKHANPYDTNWFYLSSMTSLQMKTLEEMTWLKIYKEIYTTDLGYVPEILVNEIYAKRSVELFIYNLNAGIMRL